MVYYRLKQEVRLLRVEARDLAASLEKGEGRGERGGRGAGEYPAPFDMLVFIDRVQATTIQLARYDGHSSDSRDGSHR